MFNQQSLVTTGLVNSKYFIDRMLFNQTLQADTIKYFNFILK